MERWLDLDVPQVEHVLGLFLGSRGCPWDCGLCPDHMQHSCLTLVEITDQAFRARLPFGTK